MRNPLAIHAEHDHAGSQAHVPGLCSRRRARDPRGPLEVHVRICVGHSDDPSSNDAADEVLAQVRAAIGDDPPIAAVLFAACAFDGSVVARIREGLPGVPLIGCTTDGECSSVLAFAEDSLVLTVFASDRVRATVGVGRGLARDTDAAVRDAWAAAGGDQPPSLVIVLAESLGVSGAAIVRSLNELVPSTVPVVGGSAGDQGRFEATTQFYGDEVLHDAVTILAFHGPLRVSTGVASGWAPLGSRARVTRASGTAVHEIDGQPAMDWFRRFFGDRETPSPEHPFAVYDPPSSATFYLRAPLQYRNDTGAILFAGDVPEGSEVQVTEATRAAILDGAARAMAQAVDGFVGEPSAALVFSCAARKQVLGTRTREEVDRLRPQGNAPIPLAGFYTYGEIGANHAGGATQYHNETVVAVLLGG